MANWRSTTVVERQFAIRLLRNANLSPHTFNSITLELTTVAEKFIVRHDLTVAITEVFVDDLIKVLSGSVNDVPIEEYLL